MSASLARTLFKPAAAASASRAPTAARQSVCPAARFFPEGAASTANTVSARTLNAVAHVTVGTALLASVISFLTHPDPLFFDHPPRSAIGSLPTRYIAAEQAANSAQYRAAVKAGQGTDPIPTISSAVAAGTEARTLVSSARRSSPAASSGAHLFLPSLPFTPAVLSPVRLSWRGLQ